MGQNKTHVEISKDTRKQLRVWKAKREMTYDEAINALLDGGNNE